MENPIKSTPKKTLLIAGALATTLLVGGVAIAGGKDCGERGHRANWSAEKGEKRMDRLASKLELTDEQKTQVKSIMQANREQRQKQFQQNREALQAELSSVLTDEQMEEFETMMEKRGGKMQKRMKQQAE
ncbi:MAG: Spy/CpxP family protein refolding chaperone, partial [Granulosicoccaceae bacterium]